MTPRIKIFSIALLLSLPFWWGANYLGSALENFFFWQEIGNNTRVLAAQISLDQKLRDAKPFRDSSIGEMELSAKSALAVFINENGSKRVLYEKNSEEIFPIASITKLMTANTAIENYDLSQKVTVSKESVLQEENFGKLQVGKTFDARYLLYPLLMESSNDAAYSLANDYPEMSVGRFVALMNNEKDKMGLENTYFYNPTGLDPEDNEPKSRINHSTAEDLATMTARLLEKPLIWEILSTPKYSEYGPELINNNKLLGSLIGVIGGKTGYTEEAGKCMVLVLKAPKNKGYLVNVILGSEDNFGEMREMSAWLQEAFRW